MIYNKTPETALKFTKIAPPSEKLSYLFDSFVPSNQILPFQINRAVRINNITEFVLINITNGVIEDLLALFIDTPDVPYIVNFADYDKIIYKANTLTSDVPGGRYYARVSDGVETWYSQNIINIPCWSMIAPTPPPIYSGDSEQFDDILL